MYRRLTKHGSLTEYIYSSALDAWKMYMCLTKFVRCNNECFCNNCFYHVNLNVNNTKK